MLHILLLFLGVAIGSGWQAVVAYVNLATYYLIGLPIGCILGFKTSLGVAVSLISLVQIFLVFVFDPLSTTFIFDPLVNLYLKLTMCLKIKLI